MLHKNRLSGLIALCLLNSFFSVNSFAQSCVGQPLFPAGTYTINAAQPTGGMNYHSFGDAVNAISCGVAGPVVFNVAPNSGTYYEQVIIPAIANTSATNTVTFNGGAGDTLSFRAGVSNTERATLKLNGAHNIIVNNLAIYATNPDTAFGVQLINNADSNQINNCFIFAGTTSISLSGGTAGIVINSSATSAIGTGNSACDFNVISGNAVMRTILLIK
jgi:trimeric autotransporter adhesin